MHKNRLGGLNLDLRRPDVFFLSLPRFCAVPAGFQGLSVRQVRIGRAAPAGLRFEVAFEHCRGFLRLKDHTSQ